MSVLIWLVGIPASAVAAVCWAAWRSRPRGPMRTRDSLKDYERFRTAINRPPSGPKR